MSSKPIRNASNEPSSVVTFAPQPTLQLIYDTAPIGLAVLSPDCRYLHINERLTEICGISVADHIGRSVRDCVPTLAESVESIVRSIVETGNPVTGIEVQGQRPNENSERYWITYWHPLRAQSGEIIGVNVAAEEITERKRAQAALEASERRAMAAQLALRRKEEAEMASAAAIQRAMLPSMQPSGFAEGQLDIFAHMIPAREVGGDLYDFVRLDGNRVVITIGDVCGKGVPASLFMAMTQTIVRLLVRTGQDLQAEIEEANNLLVANNTEEMFTTLFCGVIDVSSGMMIYCNCGHNPPLILHGGEGTFEPLRNCGPPLAAAEGISYVPRSIALAPGDVLVLYTDGVTEAENPQSAQFGMKRLEEAVLEMQGQPARTVVDHVIKRVTEFAKGAPQSDDITCLAVVRNEL